MYEFSLSCCYLTIAKALSARAPVLCLHHMLSNTVGLKGLKIDCCYTAFKNRNLNQYFLQVYLFSAWHVTYIKFVQK